MKNAIIVTSVASMIKQFNMPNIDLLINMGYKVTIATNFNNPGTIPLEESIKLFEKLNTMNVTPINIEFHRNPFSYQNFKAYKQLRTVLKKNKFDLLHCQSPVGGAIARLIALSKQFESMKVIYTAHGFHFFKGASIKNWLIYYPTEKLLSRITDVLITINKEDYLLAKKRMKAKKVIYLPGVGIDLSNYPKREDDESIKGIYPGYTPNDFVILSVGELNENKNHISVIEALRGNEYDNLKYLICGEGNLRQDIERKISEYNLNECVSLLGFRNDINHLLQRADLFIFPSLREGLPVSLMEAMAAGLPVIASDIRGNSDLIDHNRGGYLFELHNDEIIKKLIEELYNSENLRKKFSDYNRKKIQLFSIENVMITTKKIYL